MVSCTAKPPLSWSTSTGMRPLGPSLVNHGSFWMFSMMLIVCVVYCSPYAALSSSSRIDTLCPLGVPSVSSSRPLVAIRPVGRGWWSSMVLAGDSDLRRSAVERLRAARERGMAGEVHSGRWASRFMDAIGPGAERGRPCLWLAAGPLRNRGVPERRTLCNNMPPWPRRPACWLRRGRISVAASLVRAQIPG